MAFAFADTFDLYVTTTDATAGYWDSGVPANYTLAAGRFGGQCLSTITAAGNLVKSSGQNDAVHHLIVAYRQTAALSGSTLGFYMQLSDGATNQCCVVFRSDGAILLTSATPAGTVLATYSGAVTAINTWFAFEFEVIVNNTTGRFRARKNGNTSDDFDSGATLNTRPGTNPYANKVTIGHNSSLNSTQFDDFLWRSDASSVAWAGDVRGYVRLPASDVSTQWARAPNPAPVSVTATSTGTNALGTARYSPFTASYTGTISTVAVGFNPGFTGNCKVAIFADAASNPGAVLGLANVVTNPVTGPNTFTFGTPVAVIKGGAYWIGVSQDVSATLQVASGSTAKTSTTSYAAFPVASPSTAAGAPPIANTVNITPTVSAEYVNDTLQDGTTSYVYDATTNDADLYAIASIGGVPSNVVAVTTRGFFSKSDAGARGACVQLKSGSTFNATAWNPSDLTNVTLSNGNLTATGTGNGGVRSIYSASAGKWYWEATYASGTSPGIGIANAAAALASTWVTPFNAAAAYPSSIYVNNASVSSFSYAVGNTICIAVDIGAKLIWFRNGAGNWNNSGTANPATGVGGIDITVLGTPLFALHTASGTAQFVANFGATAFTQGVPSGFTAGFGSAGIYTSTATLLSNTFGWLYRTDVTDPATGSAWTGAAVDALTIGPRVTS